MAKTNNQGEADGPRISARLQPSNNSLGLQGQTSAKEIVHATRFSEGCLIFRWLNLYGLLLLLGPNVCFNYRIKVCWKEKSTSQILSKTTCGDIKTGNAIVNLLLWLKSFLSVQISSGTPAPLRGQSRYYTEIKLPFQFSHVPTRKFTVPQNAKRVVSVSSPSFILICAMHFSFMLHLQCCE